MALQQSRRKIDALDDQLLELLAQRLEICKEIAEHKKKNNLPIQDREREVEIINNGIETFKRLGFDDQEFVTKIFELVMKKSREVQQ